MMQPQTDDDIAWFQSTFHPVPKATLPDDCIEYSLYLISNEFDAGNDSEARLTLRDVQKYATELQKRYLKEYIWQRQGFSLETAKEDGVTFLRGRTEFGDSIEDEWVVVWLLREITKKFSRVWIKVTDTDGEFLLIEASETIPGWLEPEVAENRVWINQGKLKIIKPARAPKASRETSEKLSMSEVRRVVLEEPKRVMHSVSIEEEAFYRLRHYPSQIRDNMHHALVTIPRKVAFLLLAKPSYISPAIEAFYLRDPIALKPLQRKNSGDRLIFAPSDLVTISVRFPRVGYAQIKSQEFPAPPAWEKQIPSPPETDAYARANAGMKVACGFEMLLTDSSYQDKPAVREMKMLLDDLDTGDETLPSDADLQTRDKIQDDEKWLDINMEDLESELSNKSRGVAGGKRGGFGDPAQQENLQKIVQQFENFLNAKDDPGADGMFDEDDDLDEDDSDDTDEGDGEDQEASFDEDEFTKMMQEMMGMPPEVMKEIMSGTIDAIKNDGSSLQAPVDVLNSSRAKVEELEQSDEDDSLDMKDMETELHATGALELSQNPLPKRWEKSRLRAAQDLRPGDGRDEDVNHDTDVDDFDADFARNILASFRSSGGTGGPAASLLQMMAEREAGKVGQSSKLSVQNQNPPEP